MSIRIPTHRSIVSAIFFLLLISFSCIGPKNRLANIHGVDVSHHNGVIDWNTLAADKRIQFVFIKATEGSTFRDSMYTTNVKGAKAAGLKVGAYHFLTTSSSAEKQFENFKSHVPKEDIDLRPALDAENWALKIIKPWEVTDFSALETVERPINRGPEVKIVTSHGERT